jgi:hypothetical protein
LQQDSRHVAGGVPVPLGVLYTVQVAETAVDNKVNIINMVKIDAVTFQIYFPLFFIFSLLFLKCDQIIPGIKNHREN